MILLAHAFVGWALYDATMGLWVATANEEMERKMTTEPTFTKQEHQKPRVIRQGSGSDAVYGIGLIGAWVYYLGRATTSQERVQGFFKGLFWPAYLVYKLLVFLENK